MDQQNSRRLVFRDFCAPSIGKFLTAQTRDNRRRRRRSDDERFSLPVRRRRRRRRRRPRFGFGGGGGGTGVLAKHQKYYFCCRRRFPKNILKKELSHDKFPYLNKTTKKISSPDFRRMNITSNSCWRLHETLHLAQTAAAGPHRSRAGPREEGEMQK